MVSHSTRRHFLARFGAGVLCAAAGMGRGLLGAEGAKRPNVLFITADDMNYDAPGVYGCRIAGITPNIDRLAREGMRFLHGHVTVAVCQPSRECLMTGRYPHRNGAEGFHPIDVSVPTLQEQLRAAGYLNGIMGKNSHLAPKEKFCWDFDIETAQLGRGREPELYGKYTAEFLARAKAEGKPFFLMANSHDPHRPFAGSDQERDAWGAAVPAVRRTIKPEEVEVPGFLPDIFDVRREIAEYYTSVHRCDETVGAVLRALDASGMADNTLVMFLSDNGMALPFAKTNCYLNSTQTPWMVRWPGKVKAGTLDREHFISGIDYMPTILEATGLAQVEGMDGTSFLPMLLGKRQAGRECVFTEFHETSARKRFPMRCVQTKDFGYIVNFWADGETVFRNESQSGRTFKAMEAAGARDAAIAARVRLFQYRVLEEFYDFSKDPDALVNLIDDPKYAAEIARLRGMLLKRMEKTDDPAAKAFANRTDRAAIRRFMAEQDARAEALAGQKAKVKAARRNQSRTAN